MSDSVFYRGEAYKSVQSSQRNARAPRATDDARMVYIDHAEVAKPLIAEFFSV